MTDAVLKAPYPWFGGKGRVADLIWDRLGNVDNFIDAFTGSAVALLRRPNPPRIETVNDPSCDYANLWRATSPVAGNPGAVANAVFEIINDFDPYVANVWRSLQQDPEVVAEWANNPVNEADLHAVHKWLVLDPTSVEFRRRIRSEPDFYDPVRAGRWLFGCCCWIGGGWCKTDQLERHENTVPQLLGDRGVTRKGGLKDSRPRIDGRGHGGSSAAIRPGVLGVPPEQMPMLTGDAGCSGRGVHAKGTTCDQERRPEIAAPHSEGGKGVHAIGDGHRPQLADAFSRGRGVHGNDSAGTCERRRQWLISWFDQLRDRLRTVRVCCGNWLRVCDSESVTTRLGVTGLLLDPPYAHSVKRMHAWVAHLRGEGPEPEKEKGGEKNRDAHLYANDAADIDRLVAEVHLYCVERGKDPMMRIALCGYAGEHDALEAIGWEVVAWSASGGYGNRTEKGKANAGRERIWFSPACQRPRTLFDQEES